MRSVVHVSSAAGIAVVVALGLSTSGCRELDRFTTGRDHFEGTVVSAGFVRTGIASGTTMCLTLDADHLEDGPGALSTSDGLLAGAALRPMPQLWNDPLSNFSFGDGHIKNLIYAAHVQTIDGGPSSAPFLADVTVVVALLQSNDVEVRLLRSAPEIGATPAVDPGDGGTASDAGVPFDPNGSIFAVFPLTRKHGACSF